MIQLNQFLTHGQSRTSLMPSWSGVTDLKLSPYLPSRAKVPLQLKGNQGETPVTTFAQFQAEQDARNTIELNVRKWCLMLIDALKDNYREYAIRGHKQSCDRSDCTTSGIEYHQRSIDELKNGILPIDYEIETGSKYHKIVFVDGGASRSVHCFVDKKTGEVYKSATWRTPAKGVRYDMRLIEQREQILATCDWSGGYLYIR
jgi:hypothetical protein